MQASSTPPKSSFSPCPCIKKIIRWFPRFQFCDIFSAWEGISVSDLLAFDPLVSCHWSSLILSSADEFYMKTDISGRRKFEPYIFPVISFRVWHTWETPSKAWIHIYFALHLLGIKLFGNKTRIYQEKRCLSSVIHILSVVYTFTPFHQNMPSHHCWPAVRHSISSEVTVNNVNSLETSVFDQFAQNGGLPNAGLSWSPIRQ